MVSGTVNQALFSGLGVPSGGLATADGRRNGHEECEKSWEKWETTLW